MSSEAATSKGERSGDRKFVSSSSTVTAFNSIGYPAYLNGSRTSPYRLYKMHCPFSKSNNLHGCGPCKPCIVAYEEKKNHYVLTIP